MVRWGLVLALAACGRIGFEPPADAPADIALDALPPAAVLSGTERIPGGTSFIDVTIPAVVLERTLLTFSLSVVSFKPDDIKVTGRFLSPTQFRLERAGSEFAIDVRWSVVSWDGMSVRRGRASGLAGTGPVETIMITPPVDVTRSFVIATHRDQGSAFGDDEFVEFELSAPDKLIARNRIANSTTITLEWQIVELAQGVVRHGTATLPPVVTLAEVAVPTFDPSRAWLVYTHSASGNAPLEAQHQAISGRIVDANRLAFERGGGAGTAFVQWSLIELAGGSVQHGTATVSDGQAITSEPIAPVDPSHSFVFGGSFAGTSGRTTSIDQSPGPAWTLADLQPSSIDFKRGTVTGTTSMPWSVITLE